MKKFLYPLAMGMLIGAGVAAIVYAKINKADKEKKTKEAKNAKTYSLSTDYDWKSYLTLGEYKGLSLEKTVYTVTDEDVAEEVEYELTEEVTVTDRAIKKGDYADIDFTGTIDGEEFEGGSEDGPGLGVEEDSADDDDDSEDQCDESEDDVDLLELVNVHEGGDDHEDERDNSADECDERHEGVLHVRVLCVSVYFPTACSLGSESGVDRQPGKEYADDEDDRTDESDNSEKVHVFHIHSKSP